MAELTLELTSDLVAYTTGAFFLSFLIYEILTGKLKGGKKTKEDWWMSGICLVALNAVQRPLIYACIFLSLGLLLPDGFASLRAINQQFFWPCLVVFLLIDELLHGGAHCFSHARTPKNKALKTIQTFLKIAHRPHHMNGGNDNKGELNVTHTYVEHWAWLIILPNYWFGMATLYFGFYEAYFWGTALKSIWALPVHTNWNYDLYFLNHRYAMVRKLMFALCHVITFPTMHHHHHSRSKNSAKNMQNFLALWDWLLWGTLVIEKQRPKIYGWRQSEKEAHNVWYRFFNTDMKRA